MRGVEEKHPKNRKKPRILAGGLPHPAQSSQPRPARPAQPHPAQASQLQANPVPPAQARPGHRRYVAAPRQGFLIFPVFFCVFPPYSAIFSYLLLCFLVFFLFFLFFLFFHTLRPPPLRPVKPSSLGRGGESWGGTCAVLIGRGGGGAKRMKK